MMCADLFTLSQTLRDFEQWGVEYLHMDVMDGEFVQNLCLGTDFIKRMRGASSIPLDIHLMITNPERKLEWIDPQPGEIISVHPESTPHLQRCLSAIRARDALAYAAINPATPLSVLDEVLPDIDGVLLMTVNPGFAGQKMIPHMTDKIRRLRALLDSREHFEVSIEVDGNVSFENAKKMRAAGADMFVAGTASIFTDVRPMEQSLNLLRGAIS